jgi:hypothetical protein
MIRVQRTTRRYIAKDRTLQVFSSLLRILHEYTGVGAFHGILPQVAMEILFIGLLLGYRFA